MYCLGIDLKQDCWDMIYQTLSIHNFVETNCNVLLASLAKEIDKWII